MFLTSINGIIIGIALIVFRKKVCVFLQKTYEKFPKYEDGIKTFNIKFTVRPFFITILGSIIIFMSIVGLIQVIGS
jgi:hypothetical protein